MFSAESKTFLPMANLGKMQSPSLPGLDSSSNAAPSNPFSGIRRAGQAKRAENFTKFGQKAAQSDAGAKNQMFGGQANTQVGSMRQMKFA